MSGNDETMKLTTWLLKAEVEMRHILGLVVLIPALVSLPDLAAPEFDLPSPTGWLDPA